ALPVLGVGWQDATTFAEKSFGGNLPQLLQWDKAAGRFYPYADAKLRPEGPYRGRWDDRPRPHIAVGQKEPWPVGTAKDDISPFGCRDMAGNGEELTKDRKKWSGKTTFVEMRGRDYRDPEVEPVTPFQFRFLENYTPPKVNSVKADYLD